MSTTRDYLERLYAVRGHAIVATTMTSAKVWPCLGDGPLDVNYLPSAMGHAADIALGIALGRPDRRVVCVNGDGSLTMNLGGLITAADQRAENLVQLLMVNHRYAIVGGPPIPGAGFVDWAGLARAAGWRVARSYSDAATFAHELPELLSAPGPVFAALEVVDPPAMEQLLPPRHPGQALRDLRRELARHLA